MMDDGKVTITIEIDAELLAQVTEVLKSYGLTPCLLYTSPSPRD